MADAKNHYRQGLTLYGKRAFSEAIVEYRKALALAPGWTDCLQALGMAQMHEGLLSEALETLSRVTQLAPEDPLGFTSLSMVLQRLERIPEAEKAQSTARMLAWKQELRSNPGAPPPSGDIRVKQ